MNPEPVMTVDIDQNRYLPVGGATVDAIVTVTSDGGKGGGAAASRIAEAIMIDCSGSMGEGKLAAAQEAACVAVDTLRDGVGFAIIAGTGRARMGYPSGPETVPASALTRAAAKQRIAELRADGGTAMGSWLRLANMVLGGEPGVIRHAILLTDGKNEHETAAELDAVLAECSGRFSCDSRGVGHGWWAADLMKIAEALLGTAGGMKDPAQLPADFQAIIEAAMGRTTPDVVLRVWTPVGAKVHFLKQMYPEILDLTDRRTEAGTRIGEYPTGAWGAETREYHLCVRLEPGEIGDELLAARVRVVQQDRELAQGLVEAEWTDDVARPTEINHKVAHYSGQDELAAAIQEGLAARDAGDVDRATAKLGRAVALAEAHGRRETAKLLAKVVHVIDPVNGTVRLRNHSDNRDLDIDSEMAKVATNRTQRLTPR